jgi:proteasome accessory factor C
MSDVRERLRRLLLLVPYVSKNQGITVDALAQALGQKRDELLKDLELLTMVGRPPFQPDDFIDITVESDCVFVDLDQRFSKPPRLTAPEAAALAAAAEWLTPAAGGELASATAKLEKVLPAGARARYLEIGRTVNARSEGPSELAPLTSAITQRHEVSFDYLTQGRGTAERRRVQPHELFSHRGQWYLSAFDLARKETRLFRLDRICGLHVESQAFPLRAVTPRRLPNPAARGDVLVRFSPQAAPYVRERFGADARPAAGGAAEVRVAGDSERWLTQWVLSFGGEAVVLEPAWARAAVARAAKESLNS